MKRSLLLLGALLACGRQPQTPECVAYLTCAELVDASGSVRQARGQYGPQGTCWATNPLVAEACTKECVQQLQFYLMDAGAHLAECQVPDAGATGP